MAEALHTVAEVTYTAAARKACKGIYILYDTGFVINRLDTQQRGSGTQGGLHRLRQNAPAAIGIQIGNFITFLPHFFHCCQDRMVFGGTTNNVISSAGGAFIYRRSIAKDVWGTDDPAVVSEKLGAGSGNWDQFYAAAAELKAKGYGIISGDGDLWHAVENSSDAGWIVDGKLTIDPKREAFLDLSKQLKDNGYHNDTQDWTDAWYADMKGTGEKGILGFFGPAWLINYTIDPNCGGAEGTFGDWAVCAPPVGFFWGGTWLLANDASPNKEAVGELIHWITLNATEDGLQYAWANGTIDWDNDPATPTAKDCVASGTVMEISTGDLEILGGQNMFEAFVPANEYANGKCLTQYDETINSYWRDAVRQYTAGEKSREEAIQFFKQQVADNLDVEVEF